MGARPTDFDTDGVLTLAGLLRRMLELNPDAPFIEIPPEHVRDILDILDGLNT